MVTFTSADYLRLADNARFNAIPRTGPDLLLSAAPVAAFGFLGSNPGAITVQGSQLAVTDGTGISLVGGNITVEAGTLTAPSGQIHLVSVGKPSHPKAGGEVANGEGFVPTGFKSLGRITLTQGSLVDVSTTSRGGDPAGDVVIRGGRFVMNDSSIRADDHNISGGSHVEVTAREVTLSNDSLISASALGSFGAPGDITFNTDTFSARDSAIFASGVFNGLEGDILVGPGTVTIQGLQGAGSSAKSASLANTTVDVQPSQSGTGGAIAIRSHNISVNQSFLRAYGLDGGGPISLISSGRLKIHDSSLFTRAVLGWGGTVELKAGTRIDLRNTTIDASSLLAGGSITLSAPFISLAGSDLDVSANGPLQGGSISLNGGKVHLSDTRLTADNTFIPPPFLPPTSGNGGTILIESGAQFTSKQSTISAQSALGTGGTIHIEANKVGMTDTQVTTSVSGGPQTVGGKITMDAKNVTLKNSQLLSTATEGQGGTIDITTHKLHRDARSVIDVSSQFGTDGTVTIKK